MRSLFHNFKLRMEFRQRISSNPDVKLCDLLNPLIGFMTAPRRYRAGRRER